MPVGEKGEHTLGPAKFFVLRVLSLLQVGTLGEGSEESFRRIFISFPGVFFQGCGLY